MKAIALLLGMINRRCVSIIVMLGLNYKQKLEVCDTSNYPGMERANLSAIESIRFSTRKWAN